MGKRLHRILLLAAGMAALACTTASADVVTDFEFPEYNGSAPGVVLDGQQGWYIPVAGSSDYFVFTYAGNAFGVPQNPTGDEQFVAGEHGDWADLHARAQHDEVFTVDVWAVDFDICCRFTGDLPTLDNLGSLSLQPSGDYTAPDARSFILLYTWVDVNTATHWNVSYIIYDQNGWYTPTYPPIGAFPGPEWQNLEVDHWYRLSNTIDFTQNRITEVSITDLNTGATTTVTDPIDSSTGELFYLGGGEDPSQPMPTGFRFFTGGGVSDAQPGNTVACDNLVVGPSVVCEGDIDGDGDTDHSDLGELLAAWCTHEGDPNWNPNADLDGDGHVGHGDLGILLADWGCGVP